MNTLQTLFTIQEAAERTGLTVHTLRYYERIGLLMPVGRAANGHRRYSQEDINLIQMLYCWLHTGMPLDDIRCYMKLAQEGDAKAAERRALLENHRQTVVQQMAELQATLQLIDFKIENCVHIEHEQEQIHI
ncbi:MAG: MerR family transcriptional regulator [Chloroflexota bacterium]